MKRVLGFMVQSFGLSVTELAGLGGQSELASSVEVGASSNATVRLLALSSRCFSAAQTAAHA